MPYARISLHRGKSAEYLQALSHGVHDALVEAFAIPVGDRFHIIHQHDPALQWATDQIAAFAVSLCLFTVKAVRQVAVMVFG